MSLPALHNGHDSHAHLDIPTMHIHESDSAAVSLISSETSYSDQHDGGHTAGDKDFADPYDHRCPSPSPSGDIDNLSESIHALPAREDFEKQFVESYATEYGYGYNMTPPNPIHVSPNENGNAGHKRKGSALKTVMKRIFNRRRQSPLGREIVDDGSPEQTDDRPSTSPMGHLSPEQGGVRVRPSFNRTTPMSSRIDGLSPHMSSESQAVGLAVTGEEASRRRSATSSSLPAPSPRATLPDLRMTRPGTSGMAQPGSAPARALPDRSSHDPRQHLKTPQPEPQSDEDKLREITRPRSVSAVAIREAARHVRRASEDVPITRINASDVSPFPLLPDDTRQNSLSGGYLSPTFRISPPTNPNGRLSDHRGSSLNSFHFGPFHHDEIEGSINHRVATLEVKMMDLELAISRLQVGSSSLPSSGSPFSNPHACDRRSNNNDEVMSKASLHDRDTPKEPPTPASITSPTTPERRPRPETSDPRLYPSSSQYSQSPSSAQEQCQGSANSRRKARAVSISLAQYDGLLNMLHQERAARKKLEEQVASLRMDLTSLMPSRDLALAPDSRLDDSRHSASP